MIYRSKAQILKVILACMVAYGGYKICSSVITGTVVTPFFQLSWASNPLGFCLFLSLFSVGTVAFAAGLLIAVRGGRSTNRAMKRHRPEFEKPTYRSSAGEDTHRS